MKNNDFNNDWTSGENPVFYQIIIVIIKTTITTTNLVAERNVACVGCLH